MSTHYEQNIDEWIYLVKGNHIEHCKEQELMIDNNLIPVLERKDVTVDAERIRRGLSLEKYFPYKLLPWERFQFAVITGVFLGDDIYFHEIRDIIGRGAGKNGFIDFLAFYFISPFHGIKGYNIDLIANGEDQARTSIADLYDIINDPEKPEYARALNSNYKAMAEKIVGKKMRAEFRLNTTSTKNKDSKRTGCIIYDEKHQYTNTTNMNTLKSGLGKMRWWREITITTDGHIRGGVLDDEKEQNRNILSEYNPLNRTFVNWFRIEDEAEWNQMDKIVKANPSLAYPSFDSLKTTIQQEITNMQNTPEYYPEFLAKRCNFPVSDPQKAVAEWDDIVECCKASPFEIQSNMSCVGGVDYTKTNDFVGCVLVFRKGNDYSIMHHSFICKRSKDLPNIHAPIEKWCQEGVCSIIDEVEVPAETVAEWFAEKAKHYNITMIGIDNFRFSLLNKAFRQVGFDAFDKTNKSIWLTRPSDIIKASPIINSLFINKRLSGFDRMMCWYTNNTKTINRDGNITYGKIEPKLRKTDGFMAFVHAMCCIDSLPEIQDLPSINIGTFTY